MALGNLVFLLGDIAADLNDLHTVEQRTGYRSQIVGGGDEHHLRQVVIYVQIVVVEGVVLLGVKHFQQGRCRVTVVGILRHLVNLVENEDGVARTGFLDVLDDTSGHSTDVGTAVSANLGLVVQTAERHSHILTLQGVGNRLA